jgi:ATP-dependent protease ClpP protease subunit
MEQGGRLMTGEGPMPVNVVQRSRQRLGNLVAQQPGQGDWFRVLRNDADSAAPTRVDIYAEIGGGGWFSEGVSAIDFVAQLAAIDGDLQVNINSPGGDVFDGLAIYNALAQRPGNVTTIVDGLAASAASFIAMAGKTRMICPGAMIMIHEAAGLCIGNAGDMRDLAELLDKVSENIAGIYASHSGRADGWRAAMRAESWYTADEAVAAGLAHQLAQRPEQAALAAAAKFDLSAYLHPPRMSDAPPQTPQGGTRDAAALLAAAGYDPDQTLQADGADPEPGAVRNEAVDNSPWDAAKAWHNGSESEDPAAFYAGICAGKKTGDKATQAAWALPYKYTPSSAPNAAGVRNALGRLPQTQGLTNEAEARALLEKLMKQINPDYDGDSAADDNAALPLWLTDSSTAPPAWMRPAQEAR